MPYSREQKQVLGTITKAGNGAELTIIVPAKSDPLSGIVTGLPTELKAPFAVVKYSREDFANPSLANGLMKVILSPLDKAGVAIPDLVKSIEDKNASVALASGERFKIRHTETVKPDGLTPIVSRVFLGG